MKFYLQEKELEQMPESRNEDKEKQSMKEIEQ